MAGTNVQYIIDLIVSDKQLRTQMSKLDWEEILGSGGKDFGKTLAKGAKEAEQNIKSTLGNIDWSSLLGEKEVTRLERVVSKVITANAEKIKTIGRDGDTSGIQNIIDLVSALGNELKEVGSSFDAPSLARSVNNFMKVLAPISAKIDSLAKEPEKISAAFDRVFNNISSVDVGKTAGGFTVVGNEAKSANKALGDLENHLKTIETVLDKKYTIEFGTNLEQQYAKIEKEFTKIESEADRLQETFEDMSSSDKGYDATRDKIVGKLTKKIELVRQLELINKKAGGSLMDSDWNSKEIIAEARTTIHDIVDNARLELQELATTGVEDGINVSIKLPSQEELVRTINKYIANINKSKSIDGIKVDFDKTIGDAANIVEDKERRSYKGNEADDDVNTTKLVEKTEARFDRIAESVAKKQGKILEDTKEWRKDMLEQFQFKSGDFEFRFSDAITQDLQALFDDFALHVNIDTESLASEIKTVLGDNNVALGGSTANIDPASLASAIAAGFQAVLTGKVPQMPQVPQVGSGSTISSNESKFESGIESSGERAAEEIEEVAKQLDLAEDYVKDVVNKLKTVAKYATKNIGNEKDSKGAQETRKLFDRLGIDLAAVAAAKDDSAVKSILDQALFTKDEFGDYKGKYLKDEVLRFKGSTSKTIPAFLDSLTEVFYMLQEQTGTTEEWVGKRQGVEIFKEAQKKAKAAMGLYNVRSPIYRKEIPDMQSIENAINILSAAGENVDQLNALKSAREKLGSQTDEAAVKEFQTAAQDFYKNSGKVFYALKEQAEGMFKGTVSIEGKNKNRPIVKNANTYKQIASIDDNAVIVDVAVHSSLNDIALGEVKSKKSSRVSKAEEKRLMRGGHSDYLTKKEYEEDVLNRPVTYGEFKPAEKESKAGDKTQALKELANRKANIDARLVQIDAESKQLENETKRLDVEITERKNKLNAIPTEERVEVREDIEQLEEAESRIVSQLVQQNTEIESISDRIAQQKSNRAKAEEKLAQLSEVDVERRKNEISSNIKNLESQQSGLESKDQQAQTILKAALIAKNEAQIDFNRAQAELKSTSKRDKKAFEHATLVVEDARKKLTDATAKYNLAVTDADATKKAAQSNWSQIQNLQNQLDSTTLDSIRIEQEARIHNIDSVISGLENELNKVLGRSSSDAKYLESIRDQLDRAKAHASVVLQSEIEALERDKYTANSRRAELTSEDKELRAEYGLVSKTEESIKNEKSFDAQIKDLESAIQDKKEVEKALEENVKKLALKISEITNSVTGLDEKDFSEFDRASKRVNALQFNLANAKRALSLNDIFSVDNSFIRRDRTGALSDDDRSTLSQVADITGQIQTNLDESKELSKRIAKIEGAKKLSDDELNRLIAVTHVNPENIASGTANAEDYQMYRAMKFDGRNSYDNQLNSMTARRDALDKSVERAKARAETLLQSLEAIVDDSSNTSKTEAETLANKLREAIQKIHSEIVQYSNVLNDAGTSDSKKKDALAKMQQALAATNAIEREWANIQPFTDMTLYDDDAQMSFIKSLRENEKYSLKDSELSKLEKDKSDADRALAENQKEQNKLELSRSIVQKQVAAEKEAEFLRQYNNLLEKEKKLLEEINTLKSSSADKDAIAAKEAELAQAQNEKRQFLAANPSNQRKTYALDEIAKIDDDLITAKAQKRVVDARIKKNQKDKADFEKWGFRAGYGASTLGGIKYDLTSQFMDSDEVKTAIDVLRNHTQWEIDKRISEATKEFDERVAGVMSIGDYGDPNNTEDVRKFLADAGDYLADEFKEETDRIKTEEWSKFNVDEKALKDKLRTAFKNSLSPDKNGIIHAAFKQYDENGNLVDRIVPVNAKEIVEGRLADALAILQDKQSPIDSIIDRLAAEKQNAIDYGNVQENELLSSEIVEDMIRKEEELVNWKEKRADVQAKIEKMEADGVAENDKAYKDAKSELKKADERIKWYDMLVKGRQKLIQQRFDESKEPSYTPEEKQLHFTNQVATLEERVEDSLKKQEELKEKIKNATGDEQARLQRSLELEEGRVAEWRKKITKYSDKLKKVEPIVAQRAATGVVGAYTGGTGELAEGGLIGTIVGAIKEAVGSLAPSVDIDVSELAKDVTVREIIRLLGGSTRAIDTSEYERKMARIAELQNKGAGSGLHRREKKNSVDLSSADDKAKRQLAASINTKAYNENKDVIKSLKDERSCVDAIGKSVESLNNLTQQNKQDTEEYIVEQRKLGEILKSYYNLNPQKIKGTGKDGALTWDDVRNNDKQLQQLGVWNYNPLTSNLATRQLFGLDLPKPTVEKQEVTIKDFDDFKVQAQALKTAIEAEAADSDARRNQQEALIALLQTWAKNSASGLKAPTAADWTKYLIDNKVFDKIDTAVTPLTNRQLNKKPSSKVETKTAQEPKAPKAQKTTQEPKTEISDLDTFKQEFQKLITEISKYEKGSSEQKPYQEKLLALVQSWIKSEKSGVKASTGDEIVDYLKSIGIDNVKKQDYALTNAQLGRIFTESKVAKKNTFVTTKPKATGRTATEEAELQRLLSETAGGPPADDGSVPSGLLGLIGTLAKENTLLLVLDSLKEIAKQQYGTGKPGAAGDLYNQLRALLLGGSIDDHERLAYMNLETGTLSADVIGTIAQVSNELINQLRKEYSAEDGFDTQVHSHGKSDIPYFSDEDYDHFAADYQAGIKKQVLLTKDSIAVLDLTAVQSAEQVGTLMNELKAAGTDAEAIQKALEKSGAGAVYKSRKFDELNAQSLVKMLGVKGIESKLTEEQTRSSAREGVLKEDAKEAADMLVESTGRAIKTTIERVGVDLETITEKTDAKGNKTWSSKTSNKVGKAMLATHNSINPEQLVKDNAFGVGTKAALALQEYESQYQKLTDAVQRFNAEQDAGKKSDIQQEINELLPLFNKAEKEIVGLIAHKDKFLGYNESVSVLNENQLNNRKSELQSLAINRYATQGGYDNIAFNGMRGNSLLVDVLSDGVIKEYALEVDDATGQVKELVAAENSLVNAFQSVNRAMQLNEIVAADVATVNEGVSVNQKAPELMAYNNALAQMKVAVQDAWKVISENPEKGLSALAAGELDRIMALAENVINLGKSVQKEAVAWKNYAQQNPNLVSAFNVPEDGDIRAAMEAHAKDLAGDKFGYTFGSFDGDTLTYKLTDATGAIQNMTLKWSQMYGQIAVFSDKTVSAIDPVVKKIQKYDEALKQAATNGYLDDINDANYQQFAAANAEIDKILQDIENGNRTYKDAVDELNKWRSEAMRYGDLTNKTVAKNKRLYVGSNGVNATDRQRTKIESTIEEDGLTDAQLEMLKSYRGEVEALHKKYNKFAEDRSLYNSENQKELETLALKTQSHGKELLDNIKLTQTLQQNVDNSGYFKDKSGNYKQLGGVSGQLSEDQIKNMQQTMRSYVAELGQGSIENVKFDATTQQLTYSFRLSDKTVADMVVQYNEAEHALYAYQKQERESLTGIPAFLKGFKTKINSIFQYMMSITSITRLWSEVRRGIQYVREIDSALTELKKVTDETEASYDKFLDTASKTADKVGSTIQKIVSSTADWAKLGYSMEEAAGLAESTSVLLNVSEFQSIDEATSALVSTMQAFSYTADQSMYVVDVMNEIGNNFAISSDGIATALQDSASALMTANNSYEEAVALVAAANRVVQDPSSVGSALRTISLRLRGTSVEELSEAGEDTDGVVTSKSKLRSKIKTLSGVDILTESGAYKSTYQILLEISKVWKEISDTDQAALLELIAGKNRANTASAILSNEKDLKKAYESALDAEGSAYAENEEYLNSIQGRIDKFTNAVQTLWSNTLDDSFIKGVVDLGTGLIKIVDTLGLIPSILALIGASKGAMFLLKGLDVSKLISDIAGLTMGKKVFSAAVREETLALVNQNAQMSLSSSALVKYAIDTGLATAAQVGQMTTTQLLALSFKALGAAVLGAAKAVISFLFTNPVGWLILATGAVVGLVAAIDAATPSTEELREELDELKNSLTDLDSELNSVNSELETTQKRMAELLSMPSLSFEEEEELSRLQKTSAELERMQALLTAEQKRTKERQAEKAAETVDSYLNDRAENGNDYYKTQNQIEGYIDGYQAMIDQRKKLEEQLANASDEPNRFLGFLWETDSDAEKIQTKLDTLNESIAETEQYIDTTLGDLEDSLDGVEYGYGADKQLDYVNNLRHQWEVVYGSDGAKTNAIAEIFNRKAYSEAYDSITELAQKLQEDPDDKTIIEKIRDQIKIAEDDILASGATIEDALSYFTSLSVEHNSDTLDGITNQYAKGVEVFRRFKDAADDARTISYSDVNGDIQDITWDALFTQDEENNFKAQADEIAKVLKGCDENTRDAFARLAEGVQNGQYDFNAAIESFTASGLVEASRLIESQLSEMNSEIFKGVELSGIIDTFEEFRSVLDDVASSMDILHTAQTQMNNAGRISVKTALDIIDSTDNWNECLKIENGAITLNSEASKVLIQDKLDLAKANLQQALTTVEAQIAEIEATESSSNLAYTMEESTNMAVRSLAGNMAYLTKMMEAYTRIANGETGVNLQDYIEDAKAAQAQVEGDLNYTKNAAEKIGTAELEKKKSELEAQIKMLEGIDTVDEFKDNYDFDKEPGDKYDDDDDDDESALDKIKKKYEHKLAMLDAQKTYLENEISRLEAENKPVSKSLYEEQIKIEEKKLKLYEQERAEILATMNTVEKGSDEWNEMAEEVWGLNHAIQESTLSVVELNDAITQLYIDAFDKIGGAHDDKLTFFDDQKQYIEDYINYLETLGVDVPDEMYEKLISVEEKSLEQSYEKLADLENQLAEAEKNGLEETDEEWVRMNADIREVESSILASKTAIEEWNNAIREAEWGKFDEIMNRVNDVKTETDNVAGLFDTDDVANEDGTWTKEGITQLGLHYQQMMSAQAAAEEYAKAIEELNEEYETTDLSESEYYERLQELKDGQWDAINSTEEYKESIVDLHEARVDEIENGIEKEIEAYEELIKVKKDELDAERDLHDFRNNVKDQTKDIAALERKIASMSGSTDSATVAERTRLEAELREKQDSLNDTYYDHAIDSQSSALDDELESFEKNKNDYLEQLRQTLEQTKFLVESTMYDVLINADVVLDGIQGKADEYGITLSPKLTNPWTAASAQAQQFKTDVGESLAALTNDDGIISAYNQTANSLIAAVFASGQTQAGGYVTSVREVLDAVYQPGGSIYTFSVESGKLVSAPFEGGDTLATNFNDAVNNVLLLMYGAGGSIDNFSTNSDNLIHAPFANGSGYASEFSNNVLTELSGIYGTNGSAWLFNEQVKSAFEGAFGAGNTAADGFKSHVANQIDLIRQDIYSENPQLTSYLEQPFKTASSYAKNTFKTDIENTLADLVKTAKAKADEIDSYATDIVNDMNRAQAAIDNTGGKSSGGGGGGGGAQQAPATSSTSKQYADANISALQTVLRDGFGLKLTVDGFWGPKTEQALKDAQIAMRGVLGYNVQATGRYNKITRADMVEYFDRKIENLTNYGGSSMNGQATQLYKKCKNSLPVAFHAKGTTGAQKDHWAITDEPQYGDELVLIPGKDGNLSYMRKGTAVIPADISENLMKLGMNPDFADMEGAVKNINLMTNYVNKPEIKLDIENFLHVDNVSQDTMPELKKFVKEQVNTMVRQLNYGLKRN